MWMTSRHLSLHPAVLIALLGQIRGPQPERLAQLDDHLLRDIGVDPGQARAPAPVPLKTAPAETGSTPRSPGRTSRSTSG